MVVALGTQSRGEEDSCSSEEGSTEDMADRANASMKVPAPKKKGAGPSRQKGPDPLKEAMRRRQQQQGKAPMVSPTEKPAARAPTVKATEPRVPLASRHTEPSTASDTSRGAVTSDRSVPTVVVEDHSPEQAKKRKRVETEEFPFASSDYQPLTIDRGRREIMRDLPQFPLPTDRRFSVLTDPEFTYHSIGNLIKFPSDMTSHKKHKSVDLGYEAVIHQLLVSSCSFNT